MIHSGYVWFMGEPTEEAVRQDELCSRNMCALARNFIDFGFTVLMDTVLTDRAELDFFIALMSPRPGQACCPRSGDRCVQAPQRRARSSRAVLVQWVRVAEG
jgi:hypothetical protein